VVKSHRWFWKPNLDLHGHDDTVTLHWLNFHARLFRREISGTEPGGFVKRHYTPIQPEPRCPTDICSLCFPGEPCKGVSCPICRSYPVQ